MGLPRNMLFSCICYFMLLPTSANHNCNHNKICIASWTESYRGAESIRPILEAGAIAIFYFIFLVFARKCRVFLFSFIYRPKNEIAFSVLFIFGRKRKILLRSASNWHWYWHRKLNLQVGAVLNQPTEQTTVCHKAEIAIRTVFGQFILVCQSSAPSTHKLIDSSLTSLSAKIGYIVPLKSIQQF